MADSTEAQQIQENPLIQQKYKEVKEKIEKDLTGKDTCGYELQKACKVDAEKYLSIIKQTKKNKKV